MLLIPISDGEAGSRINGKPEVIVRSGFRDNFRIPRDPGTIPKGAANRLRRRSLLRVAGYTTKWFRAIAKVPHAFS